MADSQKQKQKGGKPRDRTYKLLPMDWINFEPSVYTPVLKLIIQARNNKPSLWTGPVLQMRVEFLEYCCAEGLSPMVTGNKVVNFVDYYLETKCELEGNDKRKFGDQQAPKLQTAVNDLYKYQDACLASDLELLPLEKERTRQKVLRLKNELKDPTQALACIVENARNLKAKTMDDNFDDPTPDDIMDARISDQEIEAVFKYFLRQKDTLVALRNNALFFTSHCSWRGAQSLLMRWVHLSKGFRDFNNLHNAHPSSIRALVLYTRKSKTNNVGDGEIFYLSPHTNHFLNPQVAIAFYVVAKWTLGDEEGLDMSTAETWFKTSFAPGDGGQTSTLDPKTLWRALDEAYEALGIDCRNKANAGRYVHTYRSQLAEVNEIEFKIAQNRKLDGSLDNYVARMAKTCIIAQTGCNDAKLYHMPLFDDECTPPTILVHQFCTWVHQRLKTIDQCKDRKNVRVATAVLKTVVELIELFLRVSVDIEDDWKSHPLYRLPVFTRPPFLAIWQQYKAHCKEYCIIEAARFQDKTRLKESPGYYIARVRGETQAVHPHPRTPIRINTPVPTLLPVTGPVTGPGPKFVPIAPKPATATQPVQPVMVQVDLFNNYRLSDIENVEQLIRQFAEYNGPKHKRSMSALEALKVNPTFYEAINQKDVYKWRMAVFQWVKAYAIREFFTDPPTLDQLYDAGKVLQDYIEANNQTVAKVGHSLRLKRETILGIAIPAELYTQRKQKKQKL